MEELYSFTRGMIGMFQLRWILLLVLPVAVLSCVSSTINSDGTVQKNTVDATKLSDTYVDLAIEYQQRGAPQIALDRVNLAISTNSDSAKAYMIRAMIYQNLNQYKDAEKDFKKAIRLGDNYSEAYVNYAVFLCDQGRFTDALKNFDNALSNPLYYTPEVAYYSRGNCYYKNNGLESANADYLRSLGYRNPPQDVYIAIAKLQLDKKNYQLANYYINKFGGSQTPDTLWLHIQILQFLIDQTNSAKERKEYTSYRDTIGKLLISNYGDSYAAQQYILRYNGGKPQQTAIAGTKQVIAASAAGATTSTMNHRVSESAQALVSQGNRKYIVVKQGDTLYSISRQNSVPIAEIKRINNMSGDKVEIGTKIYLN